MEHIIYKVTNTINNKIYIGQTKDFEERKRTHLKDANKQYDNMIFHKAIRKYGNNNFKWETLTECDSEDADALEVKYVKEFCSHFIEGFGYNMTFGGKSNKGYSHTDKYKKGMSERMMGNTYAEGRSLTIEDKERLRLSRIGMKKDNDYLINKKIITMYNGSEIFIGTMNEFSKKYNLDRSNITKLVIGKLKSINKWKLQNNW
jgi:group I intron endonuclease